MKKLLSNLIHWKVNHRKVPLILFLLFTCDIMNAQLKVQGVVTDANNLPLSGVNIKAEGSTQGVSSDFDGKYAIDVPANAILTFTFIGFNNKKVVVKGNTKLNVTMTSASENLKEIVVIGYGTQKRGILTDLFLQ